jgi:nitrate reductase NapE component
VARRGIETILFLFLAYGICEIVAILFFVLRVNGLLAHGMMVVDNY